MNKEIKALLEDMLIGEDMMDYVEDDLTNIVQDLINKLEINASVYTEEISDGKYRIFLTINEVEKTVDILAWQLKETFINDIIYLFD